jgi:serine/threonine protein kinase
MNGCVVIRRNIRNSMSGLEGSVLKTYHIERLLGSGGMSDVYLAYDEATQQDVAIKVMTGYSASYLERFRREAEAIDKLQHEHILPALDYDEHEPWYYLVMHYASAGTLRDLLDAGPLTLEEAGLLLSQISSAIQFAHDNGILHRDIKPSNILLRDKSHAYLADFGLAKIIEDSSALTRTGILMGTPEYMAPDLADGPATVSTDIYSLGVLLYQMLTARVPFDGETPVSIFWKQLRDQPVAPSTYNPAIPRAVDLVVLHALEKDPRYRYRSAATLAEAYQHALAHSELPAEQVYDTASSSSASASAGGYDTMETPNELVALADNVSAPERFAPAEEVAVAVKPVQRRRPFTSHTRGFLSSNTPRSRSRGGSNGHRHTPVNGDVRPALLPVHRRLAASNKPVAVHQKEISDGQDLIKPIAVRRHRRRSTLQSQQKGIWRIVCIGIALVIVLLLIIIYILYLSRSTTMFVGGRF